MIDFEGGVLEDICSWDSPSSDDYAYATILSDHYALFFPSADGEEGTEDGNEDPSEGDEGATEGEEGSTEGEEAAETNYLFLSSGGSGRKSSSVYCSVVIPEEATTIEVSYNFISQEYAEWVGSGFNDIFTVKIDGSPDTILSRTINNAGAEQLWEDISAESASVGAIADSNDAGYNSTGRVFDGQLGVNARGAKIEESSSPYASGDISKHAGQEVVITLTVADAGDSIFDTAALVDYIYVY